MAIRTVYKALFLACLPTLAAAATAQVEYVKPESFSDAGRRFPASARDESLAPLREHFVKEIGRRLPADQALSIAITDVDLAGEFEPSQPASREVRIVKEIYPPRIALRFRLTRSDGTVIKEGSRNLRDTSFLGSASGSNTDPLRYEKAMIGRWLGEEFR
jgi:hypothetical protein